ncbi:uncharacterized protein LOC143361044 isoform X2 [Halictus rubicundus]|uniref:uncharacterized protein LOC143361044 isoform X2 n=1 Tax=Halictus rubicundus TaxID=77578 RepID=UPI004035C7D1
MEGGSQGRKQKPRSFEISEESTTISSSNKKKKTKQKKSGINSTVRYVTVYPPQFIQNSRGASWEKHFSRKSRRDSRSPNLRTSMTFSSYRYYRLNYGILKFLRLWNTKPRTPEILLRLALLYFFLMSILVQVAALCTHKYSLQETSRTLIFIHCSYSFFNKYLMLYIHIRKVRFLFARIEQDWNTLDNTDEYDILKRYTENSKLVQTIFIRSLVTVMYGYAPVVLDYLVPLNESRPRRFLFAAEFFVIDPLEHFVSVNTVLAIVIFLGVTTMTITDGSVVMFIMHNCAMFKIAGHRLQRAINTKENLSVRTRFVEATLIHQGAVEFADVQREIYSTSYFGFLVLGSTSITMTLYRLANAVKATQATRDLTEAAYFIVLQFSYLFLCHYVSQSLINHSSSIFAVIYDTEWYSIPVPVQKLIIFIMKRSITPSILTLAKVYAPSCEGFAMICNMSMSYFMFLYSI